MTKEEAESLMEVIKTNLVYMPAFIRKMYGISNIDLDVDCYNDRDFFFVNIFETNNASTKYAKYDKLFNNIFDELKLRIDCLYDEDENVVMRFSILCHADTKHVRYDLGTQIFKIRNNGKLKQIN